MAELTWQQAIKRVLAEADRALHTSEITEQIIDRGLRDSLGATPEATVGAQLYGSIKRKGNDSPYLRVGKATFALKQNTETNANTDSSDQDNEYTDTEGGLEEDSEAGLIQAFGMYWQRNSVYWSPNPSLGGRQQIGATVVNFHDQRGVYLLYDGREVVYVGRSVDRPLGKRLYEHTQDRLRSRWDRFSWFGLRRVSPAGKLSEVKYTPSEELIAVTLEALLIEGLEPRQNRRRGDGFTAVEYLQADDPEIERQRMKSLLETVKSKF